LLLQNIEAEAGEELRIRLTTVSNLPALAMAHNWILLKIGIDPADFANAAVKAKNNEYIPQDRTDDIIAHTGLAGGGETVEVTFTVPEKTGEYDYLCSFPGHFAAGMKGKLIVQ
jgi:azurin